MIPLNFIRVAIIFHFKITCLFSVSYFGYFFASIWAAALIVPWCQLMFSSQRSLRASQRGLRASERSEGQLEGSEGQLEGSEGQLEGSEGQLEGSEGQPVGSDSQLEGSERLEGQ